jgi:hypothetical protein
MAKEKSLLSISLSVLFAILLSCGLALLVRNKLSIWHQLGTGEKTWTICASAYAIILTVSGCLFGGTGWRSAGLVHATLMLGIGGFALYEILSGLLVSPGNDNAAAGIVEAANLVFVVIGVIATLCGIAVMRRVFPRRDNSEPLV